MALGIAVSPLANPLYTEVRGGIIVDVTDTGTKGSQKSVPYAYKFNNQCDAEAGIKAGSSATIQQKTAGCDTVLGGSISIKLVLPPNASSADIDQLVTQILPDIKAAVAPL